MLFRSPRAPRARGTACAGARHAEWFDTDRCPDVAIPARADDRRAGRGCRIPNMPTPVGFDGRGRHAPPPLGVSVRLAPLAMELQSLVCVDRVRDLAHWDFLMSSAASLKGTGLQSARGSFLISPFPSMAEQVQSCPQRSRARGFGAAERTLDGEDSSERITTGRKERLRPGFFRPL